MEAFKFLEGAEAAGCGEFAGDLVLAALVVGGRTEAARGGGLQVDALEVAVEGEVEVEAGLFAVGDDVEAGANLILDRGAGGVVLHLFEVVGAELVELRGGKLEPGGEGVGADDGGSQWLGFHLV